MKRIFPALLALMIFCASLAMTVPARADSYQDGTDVVYKGWYQYKPENVPDGISLMDIDFSRVVFNGLIAGYVDKTFSFGDQVDLYISPTGVLSFDLTSIGFDVDSQYFILNGSVFSPYLSGATSLVPLCYIYLDCRIAPAEGNVSAAEFAKFMSAFQELPGSPFVHDGSSVNTNGIYPAIYDLLADAFYGNGADLTGDQTLVLTVLATIAIVFMFALPFLVLIFFLKLIGVL